MVNGLRLPLQGVDLGPPDSVQQSAEQTFPRLDRQLQWQASVDDTHPASLTTNENLPGVLGFFYIRSCRTFIISSSTATNLNWSEVWPYRL